MAQREKRKSFVNITEVPVEDDFVPLPQLSKRNTARSAIQTDDWWLWELTGILISAVALAGMVGFLHKLDGKPQPSWAYTSPTKTIAGHTIHAVTVAIAPNSILSILSTIARICVLIPITKGLAQLKWVWFAEQERELRDFEVFDNATRGVTGSMFLLWKLRFRHFAVIGAVAALLAVVFDPFVQNLLSYYSMNEADPTVPANLTRANVFTGKDGLYGGKWDKELDASMKSAIVAGYSRCPGYNIPKYYCGTGNCTWSDTTTLGVCSRCADVSARLSSSCYFVNTTGIDHGTTRRCKHTLKNGFRLDSISNSGSMVNARVEAGRDPLIFTNYTTNVNTVHAIYGSYQDTHGYRTGLNHTTMYATECILVPCVQTFNSSVGYSTGDTGAGVSVSFRDQIRAEFDDQNGNNSFVRTNDAASGYIPANYGVWFRPKDRAFKAGIYHMYDDAMWQIGRYLFETLTGRVEVRPDDKNVHYLTWNKKEQGWIDESLFLQQVFTSIPKYMCDPDLHEDPGEAQRVQCAIENIARAMTTYIRNVPHNVSSSFQETHDANFTMNELYSPDQIDVGKTLVSKTYIAVQWIWLSLPVGLWVLAVIMLIGTIWKTRTAGVRTWRASTLATLFLHLGLRQEHKEQMELHDMTAYGLERRAEALRVRLHVTEQDARLVSS